MPFSKPYPIGTPGVAWQKQEKQEWLNLQSKKRSYLEEVVSKIEMIANDFIVEQYGQLTYRTEHYPLFVIKTKQWQNDKPTVLVTGGVHGYETSGVHGALRFALSGAKPYLSSFNFIIAPCVSPWGYETINRWNPDAIDPNRSFYTDSPAQESVALMALVEGIKREKQTTILAHFDLHETTDTDNSEFRPALAARDAKVQHNWNIPDGFYLVGDTEKPQSLFQQAIIQSVEKVTHIAPADENNQLIGVDISQFGVINYPTKALGLCASVADAQYCTTTEVYPDSPRSDDENCIIAQVASITGGLEYLEQQQA